MNQVHAENDICINTGGTRKITTSFKLAPAQERIGIQPREYLRAH